MFCCMFEHLSERWEAMEVGLEGPPKSSSPSAAAVDEYKRVHSSSREGRAVRLSSLESSSSSDCNHQANLQRSVYFSHCEGNCFGFSSRTAFVKGTLWSSHSLEKLIHRITSLSLCFWSYSPCLVMIHPPRRKWKCSNCWLFSWGDIQFMEQKLQQEQK